jgi:hypothetical protein
MTRLRRFSFLLPPLLLALSSLSRPAPAQTTSARYAFADTTLLRDTLGLNFVRLFPLSDSLRVTPDTLRALSIRYRFTLARLVKLSDSLGVPVDSVGPYLERERFNALSTTSQSQSSFRYNSSYNVAQSSSSWGNGSDWSFTRQALLVHNQTSINLDRYRAGDFLSLRQTRSSITEVGWRLNPNWSIGGRADLEGFDSHDPTSISNEAETKNVFELTTRSRQKPAHGVTSEMNLFGGVLDLKNSRQIKRGVSGRLNGRLRTQSSWLTHETGGEVTGNLARTSVPNTIFRSNTHDGSVDLHGTLGVLPLSPLSLNLNYAFKNSRIQTPSDSGNIQLVRSGNNSIDAALRLRQDNDRYVSATGRLGNTRQLQNTGIPNRLGSESTRRDRGAGAEGRYSLGVWSLEGHFSLAGAISEFPHRDASGGYGESLFARSIDATLTRPIGEHLIAKANGQVSLTSYRYYRVGNYLTLPVNNDQYRQSYRIEGLYGPSPRFNTAVALEVIKVIAINIPKASTAGNNEDRTYRAEWRWTYRLLPMLTATQRNLITADYIFYSDTLVAEASNRLSLDYSAVTALNAVLTPRLTLDLTHNSRVQPTGNYLIQNDGHEAFGKSDEGRNYTLEARVAYTPTPGFSLNLTPNYLSIRRSGSVNGVLLPQRVSNTLNVAGGVSVNVPLGVKGHLTGDIRRIFRDDRSTIYTKGVPVPSPLSETDYWSGGLQLTWEI